MRLGDVVDQLHHIDGFTDPRAAEQADFAAFGERADQINHFDAGLQQFSGWREFVEFRRGLMNRALLGRINRTRFVDGTTSTSIMRPSVGAPTGTWIGAPIFLTVRPRRNPSAEPRQIARTTPSPSCCWTSSTRSEPSRIKAS